ncbi:MAG: M48 family metalloprotease [Paracoccus sp. (in: a-proteobacteria)]|nr:M48 family metalloprotease [Paracoccus sp. (in: a-proteobacteria)]
MLKFLPILLILLYVGVTIAFSHWRLSRELRDKSGPLDHPKLLPLLARLGGAMDLPPIRAHVYETQAVNGLASGDGRVFLTRGFLDKMDRGEFTPEELTGVIAHELGHVSLGHSRRRLIDFTTTQVMRGLLGRLIPFVGLWIGNLLAAAVAARLSRSDEFEADRFATALMIRAGLGHAPQVSLLGKLARLQEGRAAPPEWIMSHPPHEKRIRAIEHSAASWGA